MGRNSEQLILEAVEPEYARLALEDAKIEDALLDTPIYISNSAAVDEKNLFSGDMNSITDLSTTIQQQDFESFDVIDGDRPTLLEEIVNMQEDAKKRSSVIKQREDEVELLIRKMNEERDRMLSALAQDHLPSRYLDARQEILLAAGRGLNTARVATFAYPLNAYDETLLKSLKNMFISDALMVTDGMVPSATFDNACGLTVTW